jgi:hypothetical protein
MCSGGGFLAAAGTEEWTAMTTSSARFVGTWVKETTAECSRVYPTRIEFLDNGQYSGSGIQPGPKPGWDSGTYEVTGSGQIRISTMNDSIISYRFSFKSGRLTFTDPDGCQTCYRREEKRE